MSQQISTPGDYGQSILKLLKLRKKRDDLCKALLDITNDAVYFYARLEKDCHLLLGDSNKFTDFSGQHINEYVVFSDDCPVIKKDHLLSALEITAKIDEIRDLNRDIKLLKDEIANAEISLAETV